MKGLVYLSGEYQDLPLGELRGALRSMSSDLKIQEDRRPLIITDRPPHPDLAKRMGHCHFTGEIQYSCDPDINDIKRAVEELLVDISKNESVSFRVKSTARSKELTSGNIFVQLEERLIRGPWKLRHRSPICKFFVVTDGGSAYIGWINSETDRSSLLSRRGPQMPYNRPVGMDPRMARAMTNLLGIPKGKVILDPFMGPGGLIMEAAILGYKCIGIERDPEILRGAEDNILFTGLDDTIETNLGDCRNIIPEIIGKGERGLDCILTDPPFGKGSSTNGMEPLELMAEALGKAYNGLKKGSPVVFDTNDPEIHDKLEGYSVREVYPIRVHRSMTRYIIRMERK